MEPSVVFSDAWLVGAYQRLLLEGILFTGVPAFLIIQRIMGNHRTGLLALFLCGLGAFFRGSIISVPVALVFVFVCYFLNQKREKEQREAALEFSMRHQIQKSKRHH